MEQQVCETPIFDYELSPEVAAYRTELYNKYVAPHYNMIYKLCMNYTYDSANVPENYNEVLFNFFRRIDTYNPELSIHTWLHIVTKRLIAELERRRKRSISANHDTDIEDYSEHSEWHGDIESSCVSMDIDNFREQLSDGLLEVLDAMKPIHRDAFILQNSGYSLKEIAEIEYQKGTLKTRNIDTVKSRLFLARQFCKKHLNRNGNRITNQIN